MSLRTIRAEGVELATQAFGDAAHPPALLIMGGMASMLWWPEEFCAQPATHGRFVIRRKEGKRAMSDKGDTR